MKMARAKGQSTAITLLCLNNAINFHGLGFNDKIAWNLFDNLLKIKP